MGTDADLPKSTALLLRACEGGEVRACTGLGYAYEEGRGVQRDEKLALACFKKACDAGRAAGCDALGRSYLEGSLGNPQDYGQAAALFIKACDGRWADGCNRLGTLCESGRGLPKNPAKAEAVYLRACDGGNDWACANLAGRAAQDNELLQRNPTLLPKFERACNNPEVTGGCLNLSLLYSQGQSVPEDQRRAALLAHIACSRGVTAGCFNLVQDYELGSGTPVHQVRAFALYAAGCRDGLDAACKNAKTLLEKMKQLVSPLLKGCGAGQKAACDRLTELLRFEREVIYPGPAEKALEEGCAHGVASACRELGMLFRRGEHVKTDAVRAAKLFRCACERGDAKGCTLLGIVLRAGNGLPQDVAAGRAQYDRACAAGSPLGCHNLAMNYESEGKESLLDGRSVTTMLEHGCQDGLRVSCTQLGMYLKKGTGTAPDPKRADDLFEKACLEQDEEACWQRAAAKAASPDPADKSYGAAYYIFLNCESGDQRSCEYLKRWSIGHEVQIKLEAPHH